MASKMYRSRSNKWFAGVCGGVANYFNIDPKFSYGPLRHLER